MEQVTNQEILILLKEYSKQLKSAIAKLEKLERKLDKLDVQVRSLKDEKNI